MEEKDIHLEKCEDKSNKIRTSQALSYNNTYNLRKRKKTDFADLTNTKDFHTKKFIDK